MEKSKKYLLTTIGFLILTVIAIFFVRFRDNQIAENFTKYQILSTSGIVSNIHKNEDGVVAETVKTDTYTVHSINVGKNDKKHNIGDRVTIYSMEPNFDYYSYSKVDLVKHETNMIRYYPLFIIPGICTLLYGTKFVESKNKKES